MLYLHELFSFLKYFYEKLKVNIMIKHYFKEFKNRSFLLITTWISCIIVTFHYKDNLIYVMIEPYIKYQNSNFYFIYTEISEPFHTNLYLIIFVSNQITCFMLLYHLLGFVKPGLYKKEYERIKNFSILAFSFFFFFVKVSYKFVIPGSFFVFFEFQKQQKVNFFFEAKMNEYTKLILFSYKLSMYLTIILLSLTYVQLLSENAPRLLQHYRKYIIVLIIVLSSIMTPPDVLSQLTISSVMIVLFEIINYCNMLFGKFTKKNNFDR